MTILIDGSHLLHRCLRTPDLAELHDSNGNCTGGIHGFLRSLSNLCYTKRLSEGVIVAWDNGVPVHRRQLFNEYKPKKSITPEDGLTIDEKLLSSINKVGVMDFTTEDESFLKKYQFSRTLLHQILLPNLGCISVQIKNCEADDIISVICDRMKDDNITILSSDRDLNQLLTDNIDQYDGIKKEFITKQDVIEKYNLDESTWREEWLIGKALIGDKSDGIPGFSKIGEVAARGYAKQIMVGGGKDMDLSKLNHHPRTSKDGLQNILNNQKDIWRNRELMDLNYVLNKDPHLLNKIEVGILKSNLFEIDTHRVIQKLNELQMVKAKEFIIYIKESNSNSDIKENYLTYFK